MKLSGLRVVDLSLFLPGPMMTMMLADQGAQVTKVEPPGGDPARDQAPFEGDQSVWFRGLNRGKTCVRLDLKTAAGRAQLWHLIDAADVLVEGFRPGAIARLGFDYATVAARNPRIIYCSISAFGQSGPLASHPAHDLAVQAMAGFLAVNDDNGDGCGSAPVVPGVPSADLAAGLTALSAVLMALIGRAASGRGDYIDCSMFGSLLPWCAHIAGDAIMGGAAPTSVTQRSLGGAAFYQVYACADGRHLVLGGREAKFAATLLTALDRPDLIAHAARPAGAQAELIGFLTRTFVQRPRDAWVAWFADKDVAFAPVLDFREAFDHPHVAEHGLIIEADGGHMIAPAIRFGAKS